MTANNRWLLPEGIEELLPDQAQRLEQWRRTLLDLFRSWGYQLVIPPLVEHLDSLLTGVGSDLELDTFKIIDPQSGRLLGVRADITPQVARIDAHRLRREIPSRLCYIGPVLRTHTTPAANTRNPMQVGAELYGHHGIESDFEILMLMLECLSAMGLKDVAIDIGHVGLYRALIDQSMLSPEDSKRLFEALQRKSVPDIEETVQKCRMSPTLADAFILLANLNGDSSILDEAQVLTSMGSGVEEALQQLQALTKLLQTHLPSYPLHFDLAELRGYAYHTGVVFAAFVPGFGQEIAAGGRYDNIGKAFGHGRAATGFSSDLMTISSLMEEPKSDDKAIYAPYCADSNWLLRIRELRAQGETVICGLPRQSGGGRQMRCDRELRRKDGQWVVKKIES